jgi:lipopolysaccharide/colanic/teichoic acid biosynthesis glycosyltransferase
MSIHEFPVAFSVQRTETQGLLRRGFDVFVSAVALTALAPVILLISLAVYLEGANPIFFQQTRLGVGGRPFRMYKFRKFRADCGASGAPLTVDGDQRLTKIGKFLAATKLDELPQLWNVLKGDMAIVGPRPESMAFADCFKDGFEEVLQHKPGLVGPSQIAFRHEARLYPGGEDPCVFYRRELFPAKARIDVTYFRHRTIGSDVALMLQCFLTILNIRPALAKIEGNGDAV